MQEFLKEVNLLFIHLLLRDIPKLSLWTIKQVGNQKVNVFCLTAPFEYLFSSV